MSEQKIKYTTINGIVVPELADIVTYIAASVPTDYIKLLGDEPYSHGPYHFPYHFTITPDSDVINTRIYTITLDNEKTRIEYDTTIPSATTTTAGVMTSTDKTKLDGVETEATKVSVSTTGTATELIPDYITISGVEYKTGSHDVPSNIVTTDTTQSITGQKTFSNDVYMGTSKRIMKANNLDHLALLSSNNNYAGASLFMYGTAGGGSENRGTFNLSSCDGSTRHSLIGTIDGNLKWKDNNVITSAGGTMTGQLVSDETVPLRKNNTTGYMKIGVGTDTNLGGSPSIRVYGTNSSSYAGCFMCEAHDGTTQKLLIGKPDETLTWVGNPILRKKVLGGNLITGITNGTVNTGVSYAIDMGGGVYYLSLLISNVTLSRGETKIASTLKINGTQINSISSLSGNANSSGTFLPATAIAWQGGLWVCHYEAGTGEVRLCGMVIA